MTTSKSNTFIGTNPNNSTTFKFDITETGPTSWDEKGVKALAKAFGVESNGAYKFDKDAKTGVPFIQAGMSVGLNELGTALVGYVTEQAGFHVESRTTDKDGTVHLSVKNTPKP